MMWRFLNSIPRALKNYHGPRASVGVYVESDDKDQESASANQENEPSSLGLAESENSFCPFKHANLRGTTILWRLGGHRNDQSTDIDDGQLEHKEKCRHEEHAHSWWHKYQKEVSSLFQGSNHLLEALTTGSGLFSAFQSKDNKHNLVYRVLFALHEKDIIVKAICRQDEAVPTVPRSVGQALLAIKDASGSEQDRVVNELKCDSLDAALKDFEQMCADYACQNESLLGIKAADTGDMEEAVRHFHTACAMGNKTACFNIGLCYETGKGVTRNLNKAKHYYELAAVKGHRQAMYNLSLLYLNTDGLQEGRGDRDKGLDWMTMAAKAGLVQAQNYMGVYCMEELGDTRQAVSYFKASARQNDQEGQYFLAVCHEHGLGVAVNECSAAHFYSLAASSGHDEAICSLARFTQLGLGGLPSDEGAAKELYEKAAKLGNQEAKRHLQEIIDLEAEKEKAELAAMKQQKVEEDLRSQPQIKPLSSSLSSPNLSQTLGMSLKTLIYQRLFQLYSTCNDNVKQGQTMFDPGGLGNVTFQLGEGNDADDYCLDVDTIPHDNGASGGSGGALQKSSTTPDFASMVACNI